MENPKCLHLLFYVGSLVYHFMLKMPRVRCQSLTARMCVVHKSLLHKFLTSTTSTVGPQSNIVTQMLQLPFSQKTVGDTVESEMIVET